MYYIVACFVQELIEQNCVWNEETEDWHMVSAAPLTSCVCKGRLMLP